MIAPLKVSSNHIATTFLTAQTIRREQVGPRARLRGISYFADGDLLPASMQPRAATGVRLEELPVFIGKRDLASQGREQ
jgi:hypothetical protein